jgi:hypothetical protein
MRPVTTTVAICTLIAISVVNVFSQTSLNDDALELLVSRLDFDKYKATIKTLGQFGDRREGTEGNHKAAEWIEAQLQSYRCISDRVRYIQESAIREQVFCTKNGTTTSDEMYLIAAHMDGLGGGEAADDNASGTAVVMELARILNMPDVQTDVSIRFIFWNSFENGFEGMRAYIQQRMDLQGKEDYPGSGNYPEPRWLGVIDHDALLWDHGNPPANEPPDQGQRRDADINIEYASASKFGAQAMKLALAFRDANRKYADYPAEVSTYPPGADAHPVIDFMPFITLRANAQLQIAAGWNPHRHRATDVYSTYGDKDFLLGFSAAKTTLAAVARLAAAKHR